MTLRQFILTFVCVLGIACGQILFKKAALTLNPANGLTGAILNPWLLIALLIYGAATLLWIYILRGTPLLFAYPLFALTFVLVPLMSWYVFGERLNVSTLIGGFIILVGVAISVRVQP